MAYVIAENIAGMQPITAISTTQNHPLGMVVRAFDNVSGQSGEFIYLLGVINTIAGLVVTYNASTFQTTLLPSAANAGGPIAVAGSANVASSYGWYQISGLATVLKTAVGVNPAVRLYVSTTAGRLRSTASAGREILGARSANLATISAGVSQVLVMLDRPSLQGQIS